jgi:hypothetical protein
MRHPIHSGLCPRHDDQWRVAVGRHGELALVDAGVPLQLRSEHMFVY